MFARMTQKLSHYPTVWSVVCPAQVASHKCNTGSLLDWCYSPPFLCFQRFYFVIGRVKCDEPCLDFLTLVVCHMLIMFMIFSTSGVGSCIL